MTQTDEKIVTINVMIRDARELRTIHTKINNYGKIRVETYVRADDKNGTPQMRTATFVVKTTDLTNLRRSFTQLENSGLKSKVFLTV